MDLRIVAKFEGDTADENMLPAFEGAQSLHGIARGLVLVSHFAATGEVRHRYPFSNRIEVFMKPPRAGSFDGIFDVLIDSGALWLGGAVAINITSNILTDLFKIVFSKTIGKSPKASTDAVSQLDKARPGDVDALAEAVEPAMKLSHTTIGNGAQNVILISGDNNIVTLNRHSKAYVQSSELSNEEELQDISISSFNALNATGRAYFPDMGRTVPFKIHKFAEEGTKGEISSSLNRYAHGLPSFVEARFRRMTAPDGQTKSIVIYSAGEIEED